ncbi:serine/threonine protein kinase, putative [Plasmodium reichenowi]|uniref:Serine/threonine protein kinase, putative n=1 Tax=Plasmodium reichenowi TaxID=5854 RepID=A0A060RSU3_PLARE|nr:serine/threonine protein kinase, putative [Plasmodium reichenowi]
MGEQECSSDFSFNNLTKRKNNLFNLISFSDTEGKEEKRKCLIDIEEGKIWKKRKIKKCYTRLRKIVRLRNMKTNVQNVTVEDLFKKYDQKDEKKYFCFHEKNDKNGKIYTFVNYEYVKILKKVKELNDCVTSFLRKKKGDTLKVMYDLCDKEREGEKEKNRGDYNNYCNNYGNNCCNNYCNNYGNEKKNLKILLETLDKEKIPIYSSKEYFTNISKEYTLYNKKYKIINMVYVKEGNDGSCEKINYKKKRRNSIKRKIQKIYLCPKETFFNPFFNNFITYEHGIKLERHLTKHLCHRNIVLMDSFFFFHNYIVTMYPFGGYPLMVWCKEKQKFVLGNEERKKKKKKIMSIPEFLGQYPNVPYVFKDYMSSNDFISGINNINESDALFNNIEYINEANDQEENKLELNDKRNISMNYLNVPHDKEHVLNVHTFFPHIIHNNYYNGIPHGIVSNTGGTQRNEKWDIEKKKMNKDMKTLKRKLKVIKGNKTKVKRKIIKKEMKKVKKGKKINKMKKVKKINKMKKVKKGKKINKMNKMNKMNRINNRRKKGYKKKLAYVYPEYIIAEILRQLLNVCLYLYRKKIFHSDIKPSNIVIKNVHKKHMDIICYCKKNKMWYLYKRGKIIKRKICIKLIDFEYCQIIYDKNGLVKSGGTTSIFKPLEDFKNKKIYALPKLVWIIGITIFILLTGTHPFSKINNDVHIYFILSNNKFHIKTKLKKYHYLSQPCKDLLKKMLTLNYQNRISFIQVFKHSFTLFG